MDDSTTMFAPDPHFQFLERAIARLREQEWVEKWSGTCFRVTTPKYLSDILSGQGSFRYGSRWIAPGVTRAIHAATTPEDAVGESLARYRRHGIPEWQAMPLAIRGLEVKVSILLDLSSGPVRQRLRVSRDRMIDSDWEGANHQGQESLTQAIGRAAFRAGIEALFVPSAAVPGGGNIVVFRENIKRGSHIRAL